jgi:hypothetical protein
VAAFPFFPQFDQDDCGVMALRMVCHYHQRPVSADRIREVCGVPYGALSLLALNRGAEAFGLSSLSLEIPASRLNETAALPLIIHVQAGHYVVLYRVQGEWLYIADPARGQLCLTREDFFRDWLPGGTILALQTVPLSDGRALPEADWNDMPDQEEETFFSGWTSGTWAMVALEGITLWLVLQWLGALFGSIAPKSVEVWMAGGISLLLLLSLISLQGQWRRTRRDWVAHRLTTPLKFELIYPVTGSRAHRLMQALARSFHYRRLNLRFHGPRAMVRTIVLFVFLAWQVPAAGIIALLSGMVILFGHPWRDLRAYTRWLLSADRERMVLWEICQGGTVHDQGSVTGFFSNLPDRRGVWFVTLLSALAAVTIWAWWSALRPDGVLVLYLGLCLFFLSLSAWFRGLFAFRISGYRPLAPVATQHGSGAYFLAEGGDLHYRRPEGPLSELLVRSGQSHLLLLSGKGQGTPWIRRLVALQVDDGGTLTWQGHTLGKKNRPDFWTRLMIVGPDGSLAGSDLRAAEGEDLPRLKEMLFALRPGEGADRSRPENMDLDDLLPLARALLHNPDMLFLDECTQGLDPFQELIVLENCLALRNGRTTVIASTREELIPSVDQVWRIPTEPRTQTFPDTDVF